MQWYRPALMTVGVGVLTFGTVFGVLQVSRSTAAPEPVVAPAVTPTPSAATGESLTTSIGPGLVAVGVPSAGPEPLLQAARRGDRLDVLASIPSPADSRPITAVVVSGALVLRPAAGADPLLLEVSPSDAVVLAHLALGGTHLVYTAWSAGAELTAQQPLDERAARALLDLPPLSVPGQSTPEPERAPAPAPTPAPASVVDGGPRPATYTVAAGESLYSVASRLGVDAGSLWWANRTVIDPSVPLLAGTTLVVPAFSGFLYQVQSGDTWDALGTTFGVLPADLWRRNEMPEDASLVPGMLLFIPRDS